MPISISHRVGGEDDERGIAAHQLLHDHRNRRLVGGEPPGPPVDDRPLGPEGGPALPDRRFQCRQSAHVEDGVVQPGKGECLGVLRRRRRTHGERDAVTPGSCLKRTVAIHDDVRDRQWDFRTHDLGTQGWQIVVGNLTGTTGETVRSGEEAVGVRGQGKRKRHRRAERR